MYPDWLVVLIPVLGALFVLLVRDGNRRKQIVAVFLALTALSFGLRGPARAWSWVPGHGSMALSPSLTGVTAALATMVAAALLILFSASTEPGWARSLLLVAVAAANVAFMADHFLLRYVALEIVALTIVLTQFLSPQSDKGRRLRRDYLLLRLGDAGLASAILLLFAETGTLLISPAFEAGLGLPAGALTWIVGGFMLAVIAKLGLWPLGAWQRSISTSRSDLYAWLYLIAAPNLGLYLLYRVAPLLAEVAIATVAFRWVALLMALVGIAQALLAETQERAQVGQLGALSAMIVFLATVAPAGFVWMALLLTTLPRVLLLLSHFQSGHAARPVWRGLVHVAAVLPLYVLLWWAGPTMGTGTRAVAEVILGLYLVGAWRVARRAKRSADPTGPPVHGVGPSLVAGLTITSLIVYPVAWRPLLTALANVAHVSLAPPTMGQAVFHLLASPLLWLTGAYLVLQFTPLADRLDAWLSEFEKAGRTGQALPEDADMVLRVTSRLRRLVDRGILEGELDLATRFFLVWRDGARFVEERILNADLELLVRGATALRDGTRFFEERVLNADLAALVRLTRAWRDGSRYVESQLFEGLLSTISRTVLGLSKVLQRRHTGKLRQNLIWFPVALILAIAVALAT